MMCSLTIQKSFYGAVWVKKIHEEGEGHDKHINYFEAPQIEPIGDNFI